MSPDLRWRTSGTFPVGAAYLKEREGSAMKHRKTLSLRPALPMSRRATVLDVEVPARNLIYVQKALVRHGAEAAIAALREVTPDGYDPSDASMIATASVELIDSQLLSWDGSQRGRSGGGRETAKQRKIQSIAKQAVIQMQATRLLAEGYEPREISGIVMRTTGSSRPTVLAALRGHPSGRWKKR